MIHLPVQAVNHSSATHRSQESHFRSEALALATKEGGKFSFTPAFPLQLIVFVKGKQHSPVRSSGRALQGAPLH